MQRRAAWLLAGATWLASASAAEPVRELHFEFPGVRIGVAENEAGPTGATVVVFDHAVKAAVDVRGGAPGTVNSDALRLGYDEPIVNAVTLSGGSSYGLAVATGVANALKEQTADAGSWQNIRTVVGAIIFDLGGRRFTTVTPDEALGREALRSARPGVVPLGARGGGRFAMTGYYYEDLEHSGQGAAFREAGRVKVLVLTIVNALGAVVDRDGRMVRCAHPGPSGCPRATERIAERLRSLGELDARSGLASRAGLTSNTTITLVVTNEALPVSALQRLAVQVHNSMSRAIQPFGTEFDGDTLFAVSTGDVTEGGLAPADLGVLASEAAWDAVLASQPEASAVVTRPTVPLAPAALAAYAGTYEFAPGARVRLTAVSGELTATYAGPENMYLSRERAVTLRPTGGDRFELATSRADRVEFGRGSDGSIERLTIEPGRWPVVARRIGPTARP